MSFKIWEIALVGGAASGKTSALARLPERLAEHDLKTLVVPEIATLLMNGGLPLGVLTLDKSERKRFWAVEEQIFLLQRQMRERYRGMAKALGGGVVILFDRGEMDHSAYMGNRAFERLLRRHRLTHHDVRDSYDKVIHLVSTAVDAPQFYNLDSNAARYDTPERAAQMDAAILEAWAGANLAVIDNSTDFEGKLARVEQVVLQTCGVKVSLSMQRKFLLKSTPDFAKAPLKRAQVFEITQIYLGSESENVERSVRQVTHEGQESWIYRTKRPISPDHPLREKVEARISRSEYRRMLGDADPNYLPVHKRRYVFIQRHLICKVDVFLNHQLLLLEVELPIDSYDLDLKLPPQLDVQREVTGDPVFLMRSLARRSGRRKLTQKVPNCSLI